MFKYINDFSNLLVTMLAILSGNGYSILFSAGFGGWLDQCWKRHYDLHEYPIFRRQGPS